MGHSRTEVPKPINASLNRGRKAENGMIKADCGTWMSQWRTADHGAPSSTQVVGAWPSPGSIDPDGHNGMSPDYLIKYIVCVNMRVFFVASARLVKIHGAQRAAPRYFVRPVE